MDIILLLVAVEFGAFIGCDFRIPPQFHVGEISPNSIFAMPPKRLPKNDPQTAAKRLVSLTSAVFLNGKTRGAASELARRLYPEKPHSRISTVAGWCRGEFLDDRGRMTPEDFQQMMALFWKQPNGVQSVDEILDLARCVGKVKFGSEVRELADVLDPSWLAALGLPDPEADAMPQADERYPRNTKTVLRTAFLEEVFARAAKAEELRRPLVIYGQAGTGKSVLVEQVTRSKTWKSLGYKRAFFLNGQGVHLHLRAWYQELFGTSPAHAMRQDDLVQSIREGLARQQPTAFIVLDDVASAEQVSVFLEILRKTARFTLIVTTSSSAVQKETGVPDTLRMTMGGFSLAESKTYFKMMMGRSVQREDEAIFEEVTSELRGNPLALHFAFSLLHELGWEDLLDLLRGSDFAVPTELLREVFLPLELNFERMSPELSRKFRMLGALPRFHALDEETLAALWGYTGEEMANVRLTLNEMQKALSPFQSVGSGWRLHQQTLLFALGKLRGMEEQEREFATSWVERAEQFYPLPDISLREALDTFRARGIHRGNPRAGRISPWRWVQGTLENTFRILGRNQSVDWEDLQAEVSQVTAREFVLGSQIQRKDRNHVRQFRWWLGGLVIGLALQHFPALDGIFSLVALAVMGFTVKVFAVDLPGYVKNMARWLELWAEVNERIGEGKR
jgi:hypothetical protein